MTHTHHHTHGHHSHGSHSHSHDHHDRSHYAEAAKRQIRQWASPGQELHPLEEIAAQLCAVQSQHHPNTRPASAILFVADHGCAKTLYGTESAEAGFAFSSKSQTLLQTLAQRNGVDLSIVNTGRFESSEEMKDGTNRRVRAGTRDFLAEPALTVAEVKQALKIGADAVAHELQRGVRTFLLSGTGSGSHFSALTLTAWCLQRSCRDLCSESPETRLQKHAPLLDSALLHYQEKIANPVMLLACVGGLETAALAGAITAAASHDSLVLLDGFVSAAAAAVAARLSDSVLPALLASHSSPVPGHQQLLHHLNLRPLLNQSLSSDTLTGALLALPMIDTISEILRIHHH